MSFIISVAAPTITAPVISAGSPTSSSCVVSLVTPSTAVAAISYYVVSVFNGATLLGTFQVPLASFPYTVTGLPASTLISIYATGVVLSGSAYASPASSTVTVTTSASGSVPAQVTWNAVPAAVSSSQINMSWNAASGAATYTLQRNGVTIASNLTALTYNDTGRTPSTTYIYQVAGVNSNGTGAYSVSESATTQSSSGAQDPLTFMTNLNTSTQGYLTGAHSNVFGVPVLNSNGGVPGIYSHPSSGLTASNCTMNDHSSGDTGLAPAIMSFEIQSFLGSNNAANIAAAQAWKGRGGIAMFSWWADNPVVGADSGPTNITNATAVLSPGAAQTLYLSQCDAVVAALAQVSGPVFLRPLLEPNLSGTFWWDLGQFTAAQYIQLWQMTYNRIFGSPNFAANIYIIWNQNWNGGGFTYATQWPGSSYVHMMSIDYYNTAGQGQINDVYQHITGLSSAPIILSECGYSGNNSATAPYTYDSSQWSSSTMRSSYPRIKASNLWCQNPTPENQLNTAGYLGGTLCLNITNLPALK